VVVELPVPGEPVNPLLLENESIRELFLVDGDNLLQLTNFRRSDTNLGAQTLPSGKERILFVASADPFGANSRDQCQIFSIDRLGGDLRQLTFFAPGVQSRSGCFYYRPPGCTTSIVAIDPDSSAVVMYSSCDPVGTNPFGGQVFAMRLDGSGMQQLTETSGLVLNPDGSVFGQLPGPVAYGPQG
jgi:hypothetical protein